jgi:hypothetical protein
MLTNEITVEFAWIETREHSALWDTDLYAPRIENQKEAILSDWAATRVDLGLETTTSILTPLVDLVKHFVIPYGTPIGPETNKKTPSKRY